jgi:hypothetical protein
VVDDSSRAWWLRRFNDEEIATMAAAVFGREPDLERIARERARLAGVLRIPATPVNVGARPPRFTSPPILVHWRSESVSLCEGERTPCRRGERVAEVLPRWVQIGLVQGGPIALR